MGRLLNEKNGRTHGKLLFEMGDQFYVRRIEELIDGCHLLETIAAGNEDAGVARESRGIAGDGDHRRHRGTRELARLALGALARRIEHYGVEPLEFHLAQWVAEQIAWLRRHRL